MRDKFQKAEKGFLIWGISLIVILSAHVAIGAAELKLADFKKANIDWRQAAGESRDVMVCKYYDTEVLETQLSTFEKLTGIKVTYHSLPEVELRRKTLVSLAARSGAYDVLMPDIMGLPKFVKAGFIEPLDSYLVNPKLIDKKWYDRESVLLASRGAGEVEGATYAFPFTCEASILMCRKDLFDEAGIAKAPDTFEELWDAARKLNNPPKRYGIGLRGKRGEGLNIYVWSSFFRGFGANFFLNFPFDMTPTIASPEGIAATEFYAKILQDYGPIGPATWSWEEIIMALQRDKIAMSIDAIDIAPLIEDPEKSETAGKWAFSVIPGGKGGRYPGIFSWLLGIDKASKKKTAAWLFIQFATSPPAVYERTLKTGAASRLTIRNDPQWQRDLLYVGKGTWLEAVTKSLEIGDPGYRPRFEYWIEVGDTLGIEVEATIAGEKDAKAAMERAQAKIGALMRDKGLLTW
ncbi:sugar ABC transporter substrate-binding protein [Candidatus Aerophobetes bacterium]|nr:sugar ABC transporter substrate-binding protein [Candidatus Aerophobetes bacterium]